VFAPCRAESLASSASSAGSSASSAGSASSGSVSDSLNNSSRSSTGTKLYAVRNAKGQFKDIQTYKRAHSQDMKRTAKKEKH